MANILNFTSYYSHGYGPGRFEYIQYLCDNFDFVFVQEHWLLNKQLDLFDKKLNGIKSHCISSMDDSLLIHGRPYGGCAIIWKDSLNINVTPIIS